MKELKITDVRIVPGDSGFLIDDGSTAVLYDSGFGFTGEEMSKRIQKELGDRQLNYIFLSHSHYDHVLGSVQISRLYPNAKIVSGTYTQAIFQKVSARALMDEMDLKAAEQYGVASHKALSEYLRVDIPVEDGEILDCGTMHFTAIGLPGHTRCSMGFLLQEYGLLLGTETLGVYIEKETYLPSCLVGYQMTMESFKKAIELQPKQILVPHYGILEQKPAQRYLKRSRQVTEHTAEYILTCLRQGLSHEDVLKQLSAQLYLPHVVPVYPADAFRLNTSIMIRLIERELLYIK